MSGFSTSVGFVFSFIIIAGIVGYSFVSLSNNVQESVNYLKESESLVKESKVELNVENVYFDSGRLKVLLKNSGVYGFEFKEDSVECFDVYVNGEYISKEKFSTYMLNPAGNYYFLNSGEEVILDIDTFLNSSIDNHIKIFTCNGIKKEYVLTSNIYNWANTDYKRRSSFTIYNNDGVNFLNKYFLVQLNSSNFDFTKSDESGIVFYLPLYENLVLDITFDDYSQDIIDFSRYKNTLTLGSSSVESSDDPSSTEGVYFGALDFDGLDDLVRVAADSSLEIDKSLTISSWINWGNAGNSLQPIFMNGNGANFLSIINDGGVDDNKAVFNLSIGGLSKQVVSTSKIDSSWHHIAATYNGSSMKLYIDGDLENEILISGDIDTSFLSNYLGYDGTNYYNGSIDDFNLFNIALNESEIKDLYSNKLNVIKLNHTVDSWDVVNGEANLSVKLPYIGSLENIVVELYYYPYGKYFEFNSSQSSGPSVPGKISDLSAQAGNTRADLSWTSPDDGGSSITGYVVEYGTVSSGVFDYTYNDDAIANATITGLSNDVEWQFRVYAINSIGNGATSNIATTTPTGTYWMSEDLTTDLGVDGTANQGTATVALAQMLYATISPSASACIQGGGGPKNNDIYAQEYTTVFDRQVEISKNATGNIVVYSPNGVQNTWRATLYEYNDATGNVATLGTAQNAITTATAQNLSLTFNNAAFNVSAGNRLKVVIDVSSSNDKPLLCYGQGTQSYFSFNATG